MRILILTSIILLSLNTIGQNYIKQYHNGCNKATSFFLAGNYIRAIKIYNRSFKNRLPFAEDIQVLGLCYYGLHNKLEGRKQLLRAMDHGAHPFMLDRVRPILDSLGYPEECNVLRDSVFVKFARFSNQGEKDLAWIIKRLGEIDEKYQKEIEYYQNTFNTVDETSDSAIFYHKNKIEPIFEENKNCLMMVIDSVGIPNLRYPQIQASFILAMVHSPVDSHELWTEILYNSVKKGELPPDQYVFAFEIFQARIENDSDKIQYMISSCESGTKGKKVMKNRKKIGLGDDSIIKLRSFTY